MTIKQVQKLYKRTSTGAVQVWWQEVNDAGNGYRTVSGQLDGKLVTSAWTICEAKNVGRSNEMSPERQCVAEISSNYTKKLEQGGYKEQVDNIDEATFFKPMLAKDYDDHKPTAADYAKGIVYSQPKLDGMRCIMTKTGAWSRNGKPILTVPHLRKAWEIAAQTFGENLVLDGELYNHDLKADFDKIMSLCKKQKPTASELAESEALVQYWVYDLPSISYFDDRSEMLSHIVKRINLPSVVGVETTRVKSEAELNVMFETYLDAGFEGQIVRLSNAPYENKRTKQLLKHKEWVDAEFPIDEILEGTGNRAGMAGSAMFKTVDGKPFKANIMGDRAKLRDILARKEELKGAPATVTHFKRLTPDGKPRFGRVKYIHEGGRFG
jgi:DNA ligase-1